ncbi:hypothetical protein L873DRAFT_1819014 [Choiromyces venosus 120613-1]|uniref:Uncharacterized protein n=1 Tax=Choiromyces venosus 120613-1 TaxID=1336337 RepID=A0A3N4J0P7_9PEZI|nr:hypothetical protein L873DRAFT_1819014 [Choiromyces venosus 120613-1]
MSGTFNNVENNPQTSSLTPINLQLSNNLQHSSNNFHHPPTIIRNIFQPFILF